MNLVRRKTLQILHILRVIAKPQLQFSHNTLIFLFEYLRIDALTAICFAIVINMVNEEQRQAFDALTEQFPFFLDMCQDGCANLCLTNHLFIHSAYHLTFIERDAVLQMDTTVIAVNLCHTIVISILLQLT